MGLTNDPWWGLSEFGGAAADATTDDNSLTKALVSSFAIVTTATLLAIPLLWNQCMETQLATEDKLSLSFLNLTRSSGPVPLPSQCVGRGFGGGSRRNCQPCE